MPIFGECLKEGKSWIIRYKIKKETINHHVHAQQKGNVFFNKNPIPAQGSMMVKFELSKGAPDYSTLEKVVPGPAVSSSSSIATLTLPKPFQGLNGDFFNISSEGTLSKVEKQTLILELISSKKGITEKDVKLLLKAVNQNFPLAFKSDQSFRSALSSLIKVDNSSKWINSFSIMTDGMPACIFVHGSSVGGLRRMIKPGKGLSFDASSDIDVSIVDSNRFYWAQALGITTYGQTNTIELTDIHIQLLKLNKFVMQFRTMSQPYPVNFSVYLNEESARLHADFSLVCHYTPAINNFTIEKIHVKTADLHTKPDKNPTQLLEYFKISDTVLSREEWATNETIKLKASSVHLPGQGNHIFNDTYDFLERHIAFLKLTFETQRQYYTDTPHVYDFFDLYIVTLENAKEGLKFTSRNNENATSIHGDHKEQVQTGLQIQSDQMNDYLYGNACTYFTNTSLLICKTAMEVFGNPETLELFTYPLKKSFSNLLKSLIDEKLITNLKNSPNKKNYAYAIGKVEQYLNSQQELIKRKFKEDILTALEALPAYQKFLENLVHSKAHSTAEIIDALSTSPALEVSLE